MKKKKTFLVDLDYRSLIVLPITLCMLIGFTLMVIDDITTELNIWQAERLSTMQNNNSLHCEHLKIENFIAQPINAWSNIAYLFVGLLIIQIGIKDIQNKSKSNFVKQFPFFSIVFGGSICYLFFASFFYHSSLTYWSLKLDISAVVASCISPFTYALLRFLAYFKKRKVQLFLIKTYHYVIVSMLLLILLLYMFDLNSKGLVLFLSLGAGILLLINKYYYKSKMNIHYYSISAISLLTSFCFFLMDSYKFFCKEFSWFQPHACWHILTAITLLFIYLYFRSENSIENLDNN